jgi:hypothetical protein
MNDFTLTPEQISVLLTCSKRITEDRNVFNSSKKDDLFRNLSKSLHFPTSDSELKKYLRKRDDFAQELSKTSTTYNFQSYRTLIFCYLDSLDSFTDCRAQAIQFFLAQIELYPNLVADKKRLSLVIREMNSLHSKALQLLYNRISRAYQRYNENMSLGRPALTNLEILLTELDDHTLFEGRLSKEPQLFSLYNTYVTSIQFVEQAKGGKDFEIYEVKKIVLSLSTSIQKALECEVSYRYNNSMVKHYVRDVLIPHSVLNGFINPRVTSDYLGAIWQLLVEFDLQNSFFVCKSLLVHPLQDFGSHYSTLGDYSHALDSFEFKSKEILFFSHRYEQRKKEVEVLQSSNSKGLELCKHFYFRLGFDLTQLKKALEVFLQKPQDSEKLYTWLQASFFSIDQKHGLISQSLNAALNSLALQDILSSDYISDSEAQQVNSIFHNVVKAKIDFCISTIQKGISNSKSSATDPYPIKEALVEILLEGIYQKDSDWVEEQLICEEISKLGEFLSLAEKEELGKENKAINLSCTELISKIENLQSRASSIKIDTVSLKLWYILTIGVIKDLNGITHNQLLLDKKQESLTYLVPGDISSLIEVLKSTYEPLLIALLNKNQYGLS